MRKELRIKKSQEFSEIMKNRKFYSSPVMTIYVKAKAEEVNRVGLSVGKKIGNAVMRNKVKRQLRMMVQETYTFEEKFDTIILVREKFIEESYDSNKKVLEMLLKKVKI
jgi:ribonuclease P protein component